MDRAERVAKLEALLERVQHRASEPRVRNGVARAVEPLATPGASAISAVTPVAAPAPVRERSPVAPPVAAAPAPAPIRPAPVPAPAPRVSPPAAPWPCRVSLHPRRAPPAPRAVPLPAAPRVTPVAAPAAAVAPPIATPAAFATPVARPPAASPVPTPAPIPAAPIVFAPDATAPMPSEQAAAAAAAMSKPPTSPEAWSVDDMLAATDPESADTIRPSADPALVSAEASAQLDTVRDVDPALVEQAKAPSEPPVAAVYTPPPAPAPARVEPMPMAPAPSTPGVVVPAQPAPVKKGSGALGWFLALLVVLGALAAGAYWAYRHGYLDRYLNM